uniref:UPF0481 protein At3g47200 family n=2 Tax=Cajanus cajan TaxID=3821 RepID=A0A151QZM5_CAJCA|nr:UPF0481 protein At3g47200 family [Cajanus cajan]
MFPITVMLGSLNHAEVQACSISSVPDELRNQNDKAFKPKVVSIGPIHCGSTRQLQLMEETKWHYMREFLDRNRNQGEGRVSRIEACGHQILQIDNAVRASYGGNTELEPKELAKLMIVDGCFVLEFLFKLASYMIELSDPSRSTGYSGDPIFEDKKKVLAVMNDITMLENQIPLVVLKSLYRKVFPHPDGTLIHNDHRVVQLVREAFGYPQKEGGGGAHILNLMHLSTVEHDQYQRKAAKKELTRCATRLRAVGIVIQAKKPNSKIELEDRFNFDIKFNHNKLEIPTLQIKETTEVKWRNLIAWEQSKISIRCKFTSYALFFRGLICCKHDIELLEEKKVIVNESGKSKEDLLKLFLTISKGAEHMDSSYGEICSELNMYRERKVATALQWLPIVIWHLCRHAFQIIVYYGINWYKILIRDHISTVWKLVGVLAATVLLILTIMQTIYSARSSN